MIHTGILSVVTLLTTTPAHANCDPKYVFCNPLEYDTIGELILALTDGITIILMPVIVLGIAYIGFRMVFAGQQKNADYTKWKDAFAWSLVGLFLVLGARGILFVIQNTLNDVLDYEYEVDVIERRVDGGWSDWGACANGKQTRTCTNPTPSGGGKECEGPESQNC